MTKNTYLVKVGEDHNKPLWPAIKEELLKLIRSIQIAIWFGGK